MPAQQREMRKNYIGILNDKVEEQRAVDAMPRPITASKTIFLA
jgi:hypothetical protein